MTRATARPAGVAGHRVRERSLAARILSVLDAFTLDRPELTLTQVSRRAVLPLTTTHRLVGELEQAGLLERDARGRYRIGLRLWEIASTAPRALGLRDAALPFMEDLYEAMHENVQLAVRDGLDVVYLERISGRTAVPVLSRVGARWPLHATGVGLVLLAHAGAAVQEDVLSHPLQRFTERTITDPVRLRTVLADVRRTGSAVSDGQITLDAMSVAAPVRGPDGAVVAALSVVVPATEGPQRYVPAVVAAARGIGRALATTNRL
jgi:DNA-binding IclR family transcriptional regulator